MRPSRSLACAATSTGRSSRAAARARGGGTWAYLGCGGSGPCCFGGTFGGSILRGGLSCLFGGGACHGRSYG